MPYGVQRQGSTCRVYKKTTGKTVGHTPCSRVNKYLAALHAHDPSKPHVYHHNTVKKR